MNRSAKNTSILNIENWLTYNFMNRSAKISRIWKHRVLENMY